MLARGLAGEGHGVRVVGINRSGSTESACESDNGVQVWRLREPQGRWGWLLARRRLFETIARWSRAREIDLVELPDWEGWAAGWPSIPIPVVTRLHGSATYFAAEMGGTARLMTRLLERASLRRADFWCSVSRYTADRTRKLFGLRNEAAAILQNPMVVPVDAPDESRTPGAVIFSGTLTTKKGVVSLIDAWPAVHARCPVAHLHVFGRDSGVGSAPSMQAVLQARLPDNIRPTVTFYGYTDRDVVLKRLRQARVAVFPSFAEACAMAPLEAMACGCPTISSARGSGSELFEHGRDGLLVDPADPPAIAEALASVLTDDALARRLGDAARQHVIRAFSLPHLLQRNMTFYRECIEQFAARHRANGGAVNLVKA
jgi:glycosyltransferase involved in cell wall biosynthesis